MLWITDAQSVSLKQRGERNQDYRHDHWGEWKRPPWNREHHDEGRMEQDLTTAKGRIATVYSDSNRPAANMDGNESCWLQRLRRLFVLPT